MGRLRLTILPGQNDVCEYMIMEHSRAANIGRQKELNIPLPKPSQKLIVRTNRTCFILQQRKTLSRGHWLKLIERFNNDHAAKHFAAEWLHYFLKGSIAKNLKTLPK